MSRIRNIALVSISLFVLGGFVGPVSSPFESIRLKYFNVTEEGKSFILTWESAEEDAVLAYELERKTTFSNNEFLLVKELPTKGADVQYMHRDDQIFKAGGDVVDYRLMAIHSSGAREILVTKSVNYTPTALRRTWGSIKAMF
ncbi:MAG: hypothetical protein HKN13_12440 [Rhodothermales bacterium]|nr:hypothetical protein [Rhodothermales bacterium]